MEPRRSEYHWRSALELTHASNSVGVAANVRVVT